MSNRIHSIIAGGEKRDTIALLTATFLQLRLGESDNSLHAIPSAA